MKTKLIQLWGLPGSGKSTLAKKMCEADGNLVRVNKDLLREMLLCNHWVPKKEGIIQKAVNELIRMSLREGKSIIVDETSLNPVHAENYKRIAAEAGAAYELLKVETDVFECIRRDNERKARGERFVGRDVILNMAFQWGIYRSPNTGVVFDMDGTLADCSHRRHFVRNDKNDPDFKKDWRGFFVNIPSDTLRIDVYHEYIKALGEGHDILIVSGRPDNYRKQTEEWLDNHSIVHDRLIMRQASDSRPDTVVKQEIIDKYLDKSKIVKWFDDRPSIVAQVRTNGINVIDVGNGVEF
jgi:predicted kinase